MKKISFINILFLIVIILSSCKIKELNDLNTINIWATAKEEEIINIVVDDYNKKNDEKINVKFKAISEADCGLTLAIDPTIKDAPALFLIADDQINNLASKNILFELKDTRKENIIKNTNNFALNSAMIDESLYGYPVTMDNGYFLWYNKSFLNDEDINNFETILNKASYYKKNFLMEINNGWYANTFIMSPEAEGLNSLFWKTNKNGNYYETTWDSETSIMVCEYIESIIKPYYEKGIFITGGNADIVAGFKNQSLIAAVSGIWLEKDLKEAIGNNLGAAKLPEYKINNKQYQMASFGGTKVYCINKTRPIEEQKIAVKLAELLTNKENQLLRFKLRGSLPCNNEAIIDKAYLDNVSIGAKALQEQSNYACIQAKTAENRYWDVGKAIGQAYLDGQFGSNVYSWKQFLKNKCNILRKVQ